MLKQNILYFMDTVELKSFSSAAKKNLVSQSAISQQIEKLEMELQTILFDRQTYRPTLTKDGSYFYVHVKRIKTQCDAIQLHLLASKTTSTFRVGITGPLEDFHLPTIVSMFKMKYPDIDIEVKRTNFQQGIPLLEQHMLDVFFSIQNEFKEFEHIQFNELLQHEMCVVCSKDHPFADKAKIQVQSLQDEKLISLSKNFGQVFYHDFLESFKLDQVKPNIIKEYDSLEEVLLAIKLKEGIALLAREVVQEDAHLAIVPLCESHHNAIFGIGYLKCNHNPILDYFLTTTKRYFSNYKNNL